MIDTEQHVTVVLDLSTPAGRLAHALATQRPVAIEVCEPLDGRFPDDWMPGHLDGALERYAEQQGLLIVTEHGDEVVTGTWYDVRRRWALAVPWKQESAPPDPRADGVRPQQVDPHR